MPAKNGIPAAKGVQRFVWNKTLFGQHHVLRDTTVTLAEDHAVAPAPLRLIGAKAQNVVVQNAHDFDERHRRADVSALAAMQRPYYQTAQIFRALVERRRCHVDFLRRLRYGHSYSVNFSGKALRKCRALASCRILASLQLPESPASARRRQSSGINSLSMISTQRQPNSGR